jgi:hypothetical protein
MKKSAVYIGIDPGVAGGLAYLDGSPIAVCTAMPATERDTLQWLALAQEHANELHSSSYVPVFAVIEKVGGFIRGADKSWPGGGAANGSRMFKFGTSYGGLRMALVSLGIPFDEVTPQKWHRAIGVIPRGGGESRAEFKNRLKAKSQQLYPRNKVTLAVADALLLATYCQRLREGKL